MWKPDRFEEAGDEIHYNCKKLTTCMIDTTNENNTRRDVVFGAILIMLISALAYLPLAHKLGYYFDDWYLIYSGYTQGVEKFAGIFAIDRPARAWLVGNAYRLFGANPLFYNYSACLMRMLASLGFFWIMRMVWPKHRRFSLTAALLFALYPGFMDMPNAIDYQSHLVSFALAIFSIAFSVRAILVKSQPARWVFSTVAMLFALGYLALMEYYIGLEGLRVLLLWYLARNIQPRVKRLGHMLLHYLPALAGVLAFLVWRMFFFEGQRAATDIGGMFSSLLASPLMQGAWMLIRLAQDVVNVTVLAWGLPLYQTAFELRLRDQAAMLAVTAIALWLVALVWYLLFRRPKAGGAGAVHHDAWRRDALLTGLAAVLLSLLPIALGDRHVVFPVYGRFSLPGSAGAAIALAALLAYLSSRKLQLALLLALLASGVMTHYGNAVNFAAEWQSVRSFWWQAAWRIPQIKPGTTLLADYPASGIFEDYFIWGPANLIYYPEKQTGSPTPVTLPAALITRESVNHIVIGEGLETVERRSLLVERDYSNVLLLSMPGGGSCLHVLNGLQPELSDNESYEMAAIAVKSNAGAILIDESPHQPPAAIFGQEPDDAWCYIYEKADLARQQGDWEAVTALGNQALQEKQHPMDYVEWYPFIQAYAYTGQDDKVRQLMSIVAESPYLMRQGCTLFKEDKAGSGRQFPAGQQLLVSSFCK